MGQSIVEFDNVSFGYNEMPVLQDITFTVNKGDFIGVVGPNGGGKTTLLKLALGLLKPTKGAVRVLGSPAGTMSSQVGYVPQFMQFDRDFPVTVSDVVLMGRLSRRKLFGRYSSADRIAAESAMEAVDIVDLRDRPLGQLSGGQRQRVFIARALASGPEVLFLDEPTASVDSRVEQDIYDLLRELNRTLTIVLVTHDLGFISSYINKVACVNRRLVCNPTQSITQDTIFDIYQRAVQPLHHSCEL